MNNDELLDIIRGAARRPSEHTGTPESVSTNRKRLAALDELLAGLADYLPRMGSGGTYVDDSGALIAGNSPEQQAMGMAQTIGPLGMFDPKISPGTLRAITAWHGSPHKFDRFDMSKIGTGERLAELLSGPGR